MDGISLVNTGLAAAALTVAGRLVEALIKKSSLFKHKVGEEPAGLSHRISQLEGRMGEMEKKDEYSDVEYRLNLLEKAARRHGWVEITYRGAAGND